MKKLLLLVGLVVFLAPMVVSAETKVATTNSSSNIYTLIATVMPRTLPDLQSPKAQFPFWKFGLGHLLKYEIIESKIVNNEKWFHVRMSGTTACKKCIGWTNELDKFVNMENPLKLIASSEDNATSLNIENKVLFENELLNSQCIESIHKVGKIITKVITKKSVRGEIQDETEQIIKKKKFSKWLDGTYCFCVDPQKNISYRKVNNTHRVAICDTTSKPIAYGLYLQLGGKAKHGNKSVPIKTGWPIHKKKGFGSTPYWIFQYELWLTKAKSYGCNNKIIGSIDLKNPESTSDFMYNRNKDISECISKAESKLLKKQRNYVVALKEQASKNDQGSSNDQQGLKQDQGEQAKRKSSDDDWSTGPYQSGFQQWYSKWGFKYIQTW